MNNIDRIMYLIDWNRSQTEQQEGLSLAREVICIKAFFQPFGPGYGKSVWDNCATIVCERTDAELLPYITDMLLWLQDLNWPGAEQIQRRLIEFHDVRQLSMVLDTWVPVLEYIGETSWLVFLSDLLKNQKLRHSISNQTLKILVKHSLD